jgi:hypothetical protein
MSDVERISDVFKTTGQPSVTYVQRNSGNLEKRLAAYLDEAGQLCLITGPSKTGKTTLYKKVLADRNQVPLIVQCTKERTSEDLWKLALEELDFDRVTSVTKHTEIGKELTLGADGKLGWGWLAQVTGKAAMGGKLESGETEIREKMISRPSPDVLIPVLKYTNYVLVIEDFHYLADQQKILLFQQ